MLDAQTCTLLPLNFRIAETSWPFLDRVHRSRSGAFARPPRAQNSRESRTNARAMGQYLNCPTVFGGVDQNRLMAAYEPGKTNDHDINTTPAITAVDGTAPTRGNGATRAKELANMGKKICAYGYGEPLLKKKHLCTITRTPPFAAPAQRGNPTLKGSRPAHDRVAVPLAQASCTAARLCLLFSPPHRSGVAIY